MNFPFIFPFNTNPDMNPYRLMRDYLKTLPRPSDYYNIRTWQPGPFTLTPADPTGTVNDDVFELQVNDYCALIGLEFNLFETTSNAILTSWLDLISWTPLVRWNDVEMLESYPIPGTSAKAVTTIHGYINQFSTNTFGTSANKLNFASGYIPIMNNVGNGGRISVGIRKTGSGGTINWMFSGVLYFIPFKD